VASVYSQLLQSFQGRFVRTSINLDELFIELVTLCAYIESELRRAVSADELPRSACSALNKALFLS
jgi:hypothetical protein